MSADFEANRSIPYEVTARDLLPRRSVEFPTQGTIDATRGDERLRLRAVRIALVTANNQVISDEHDKKVFLGCLVATSGELTRILSANLVKGNLRVVDVLVRAGLRPPAEVLCAPSVVEGFSLIFGKELLRPEMSITMRDAFCNLVLGITLHSEVVRNQFLAALRGKEKFVWAMNKHLVMSLGRYQFAPPTKEYGRMAAILGSDNVNNELRTAVIELIDSGKLRTYFREKADIAASQLRKMFLGGEKSDGDQLGHTA